MRGEKEGENRKRKGGRVGRNERRKRGEKEIGMRGEKEGFSGAGGCHFPVSVYCGFV